MTYRPNLPLPAASTTQIGGIKPDGTTITTLVDGTASVVGVSVTALTDIGSLGGPALSDVEVVNRSGSDYQASVAEKVTLFRRTPAGSRTVTLSSGSTSATLTASDHDKTVVVTGGVAGAVASDGTLGDGFRCQLINHSTSSLSLSGLSGLQGISSVPSSSAAFVSLSAAALEVSALGGSSGVSVTTVASSGNTQALTFPTNGSSAYDITLTANCTLTLAGGVAGQYLTVILLLRGGAGGFTVTLPSGIKWPGGAAPTFDTSAGAVNFVRISTTDGGTTLIGSF